MPSPVAAVQILPGRDSWGEAGMSGAAQEEGESSRSGGGGGERRRCRVGAEEEEEAKEGGSRGGGGDACGLACLGDEGDRWEGDKRMDKVGEWCWLFRLRFEML